MPRSLIHLVEEHRLCTPESGVKSEDKHQSIYCTVDWCLGSSSVLRGRAGLDRALSAEMVDRVDSDSMLKTQGKRECHHCNALIKVSAHQATCGACG